MRPFDDGPRRAAELEAYHALWNLWRSSQPTLTSVQNWESACRMLETYYTVNKARQDPEICEMRIRYLEIAEPPPRLADFVQPPAYDRLPDAQRQLAHARYQYQLARRRHPVREQQRLKELETTRALHTALKAAEARARVEEVARQREWQLSRWPKDVVLESEIYNLDGVAAQVEGQNAKIESQVVALTDLLRAGLRHLPDVSMSTPTDGDRAGAPAELAAHVESVLTAMPLPCGITPKPAVEYLPAARELVVEYVLPTVDVVPKAKAYRYVKTRETVVETARPAGQVKALYASTIAQLTLLSLATVFELDGERQFDVVIFNGAVDTLDPSSGQPIRPCLISVRVNADAFAGIDLVDVDPSVCLKRLSAVVSPNPTEFVPVRPLAE
jgi:restriction system protein